MGSKHKTINNLQVVDLLEPSGGFRKHIVRLRSKGIRTAKEICKAYVMDKSHFASSKAFDALGISSQKSIIAADMNFDSVNAYVKNLDPDYWSEEFSDDYNVTKKIGRLYNSANYSGGTVTTQYVQKLGQYSLHSKKKVTGYQCPTYNHDGFEICNNHGCEPTLHTIYNGEQWNCAQTYHMETVGDPLGDGYEEKVIDKTYWGIAEPGDCWGFEDSMSICIKFTIEGPTTQNIWFPGYYKTSQTTYTDENGVEHNATKKQYFSMKDTEIYNDSNSDYVTFYVIREEIIDNDTGDIVTINEYTPSNGQTENVYIPQDNSRYVVIYTDNGANPHERNIVAKRSDILQVAEDYGKCLMLELKSGFNPVGSTQKNRAAMMHIALGSMSVDNIYSNSHLRNFIIMSIARAGEKAYNEVAPLYNGEVTIQGNSMYLMFKRFDINGNIEKRTELGEGYAPQGFGYGPELWAYPVPTGYIRYQGMKDFYDSASSLLRAYANTEQTVKVHWYQTGFFRFILAVAGVMFGQPEIAMLAFTASIILDHLNVSSVIKTVLNIVLSVLANGGISSLNIKDVITLDNVFKLSSEIFTIQNNRELHRIGSQIKQYEEERKSMEEELMAIVDDAVNPFDDISYNPDDKFYLAYDFPYNDAYELATTSAITEM